MISDITVGLRLLWRDKAFTLTAAQTRLTAHKIERSTRPPSSGKPGTMLKTPSARLTGPSHSSSVAAGPRLARA